MTRARFTGIVALYSAAASSAVLFVALYQNLTSPIELAAHQRAIASAGIYLFFLVLLPVISACCVAQLLLARVLNTIRRRKVPWIACMLITLGAYPVYGISAFSLGCLIGGKAPFWECGAVLGFVVSVAAFASTFWLSVPAALAMALHMLKAGRPEVSAP